MSQIPGATLTASVSGVHLLLEKILLIFDGILFAANFIVILRFLHEWRAPWRAMTESTLRTLYVGIFAGIAPL